jgi:putative chitinase
MTFQATAEQIAESTGCSLAVARKWEKPLNDAMAKFGINTSQRAAAFLSQLGHETAGLSLVEENLNYSTDGLMKVFSKYFASRSAADQYARKPERIANLVYSGRMGNGDESSGDGWKYRGRGPIQLTGKTNYREAGRALGYDLISSPELVADPEVGSLVAAWFWSRSNLNKYADRKDNVTISKIINTGSPDTPATRVVGLQDRMRQYDAAMKALA